MTTREQKIGATNDAAWSIDDAAELYRVGVWSDGFFDIDDHGEVIARPKPGEPDTIRLSDVVDALRARGISAPVLLRFQDVLRARVQKLHGAFRDAIDAHDYGNVYHPLYPIKVNQLHEVVEEVLDAGEAFGLGLECGSKAELVAALPHLVDDDMLLVCNGIKDQAMLGLIHMAQRLGKQAIPIVEKFTEFEQWMELTADSEVRPQFGARIRLTVSGSGRWHASSGDRSKFGISIPELVEILERLGAAGRSTDFVLLHFHLGSQIADVSLLRLAVKEISQIYAHMCKRGFDIRYLDVGGGLGVHYDARSTEDDPAINYSLREYANTVVTTIADVCEEQQVACPVLLSESGRSITAHHSLLVVEVLGSDAKRRPAGSYQPADDDHALIGQLADTRDELGAGATIERVVEAYHRARAARMEAQQLLQMGFLGLDQYAQIEQLYWAVLDEISKRSTALDPDPRPVECDEVEDLLVDNYLVNFSVFQSMLDHWAIGQSFPIMPLQCLHQQPTRRARLVDLTCDSDGKVSHYVTGDDDDRYIRLHDMRRDQRYYLGLFLMGAYQDIMGDAHNLFGRVPEAHIYAASGEPGGYWIEKTIPGIDVRDMLEQVQYFSSDLQRRMEKIVRSKIDEGVIRPSTAMEMRDQYTSIFSSGTYCDSDRIDNDEN